MKNLLLTFALAASLLACKKESKLTTYQVSSIKMICNVEGDTWSAPDIYLVIKQGNTVKFTTGYKEDSYS